MKKIVKIQVSMAFAEELTFHEIHCILKKLSIMSGEAAYSKHIVGKTIRRRDTEKERRFGKLVSAIQKMILIKQIKSSKAMLYDVEPNKYHYKKINEYIGIDVLKWRK